MTVPVSDLFGVAGRELLTCLAIPEPWATTLATSLRFVDELEAEIGRCEAELRAMGADHPYVGLLQTMPGVAWVLGYTIAAEIGDVGRFSSPKKLAGYTRLCPLVRQSGGRDDRGPLAKNGPKTHFVVDPVEELIGIFMAQCEPFAFGGLADEYWSLVCQSLID